MTKTAILVACFAMTPWLALAATSATGEQAQSTTPHAAAPNLQQPGQSGPNATQSPLQTGKPTVAQRLSASNGTIHPPPVDTGMVKVPPPTAGTMPIVKPPGNVQSK